MRWLVRWPGRGLGPSVAALAGAAALVVAGQAGSVGAAGGATARVATAVTTPASAAVASTSDPWSTLEQQAIEAVNGVMGAASSEVPSAQGPIVRGTVSTADGPVSVVQRTVVMSGGSGQLLLSLSWLGGTQLVVSAMAPAGGFSGVTLVLAPGTAQVDGVYPLGGASAVPTAEVRARRAVLASDAAVPARRGAALAGYLGCYPAPQPPTVIGSVYGPLIDAVGVVSCPNYATIAIIAGMDEWGTEIGTASGSAYGTYYAVNVYHACYMQAAQNQFTTVQLWSVDGVLTGATSGASYLGCA